MRLALLDDDESILKEVRQRLECMTETIETDYFSTSTSLLNTIKKNGTNYYDLLILDHIMPDINGLDLAHMLRNDGYTGLIVFLTCEDGIIDDTFRVLPFRFLRKPIDTDRFDETILSAIKKINKNRLIQVPISSADFEIVKMNDILLLEGGHRKTKIITKDKDIISTRIMSEWLKHFESEDIGCFVRVSKSYVVNLEHVKSYTKVYRGGFIRLDMDNLEVEVGNSYWNRFIEKMNFYSLSNKVTI